MTVCRICLSQQSTNNSLTNFFSNTVVEGYIISVPEMVLKCLDIEVTTLHYPNTTVNQFSSSFLQSEADDGLPIKICDACKKQITNFHLFKEKSSRTEQILLNAFDKPIRDKSKRSAAVEKPPSTTIGVQTNAENLFSCLDCKMVFKTENLLGKHVSGRHAAKKVESGCQTDDVTIMTDDQYIEDMPVGNVAVMNYKREMKVEALEPDDIDIEELNMEMDMDDVASEQRSDFDANYEIIEKDHVQDEYQCNDCLEKFPELELFHNHKCPSKVVLIVNESNAMVDSDALSESYYDEDMIHEVDLYECFRCHATFGHADEYAAHRTANDCEPVEQIDVAFDIATAKLKPEDYHQCSLCKDKRFKTTSLFNQHRKLHESIEIVIDYLDCSSCDDCHKIFLAKVDRQQHNCPKKRRTDDNGDYVDESCTDYQYLENDNDFKCDKCSMEFNSLNVAKLHIVTHAKEFVCPFEGCGCSYEVWSRFAMHLSTKHLNAKQYQCKFCNVECESFDALQAHCKNECTEKKFKCSHCGKIFFNFFFCCSFRIL